MTLAEELSRYLALGITLQYLDYQASSPMGKATPEIPVYFKKTHSPKPDALQALWSGHDYRMTVDRSM